MALCQRSACGGARWTLAVKQLAMQGVRRDAPRAARRVAKNGVWRSAKLLATSAVAQTGHIVCLETRADVSSIVAVAPTS